MEMTCHPRPGGAVVPKAYGGGHRNQLPIYIILPEEIIKRIASGMDFRHHLV